MIKILRNIGRYLGIINYRKNIMDERPINHDEIYENGKIKQDFENEKECFNDLIEKISNDIENGSQIKNIIDGYKINGSYNEILRIRHVIGSIGCVDKTSKFEYVLHDLDQINKIGTQCKSLFEEGMKSRNIFDKIYVIMEILRTESILRKNYLTDEIGFFPEYFIDSNLKEKLDLNLEDAVEVLINTKNPIHILDALSLLKYHFDEKNKTKVRNDIYNKAKKCYKEFIEEKDYTFAAKLYYSLKELGFDVNNFNLDNKKVNKQLLERWNNVGMFDVDDLELVNAINHNYKVKDKKE